ncbi:MAG: hypothetical protein WC322_02995 [Candidatus Paceibacterota bacterium]|jgi:hypothetical protein
MLVQMAVGELTERWRPGSADWGWASEAADILDTPTTAAVRERVAEEGYGFADDFGPVLLGSDGRVWDGHHRICLALEQGPETLLWVEQC